MTKIMITLVLSVIMILTGCSAFNTNDDVVSLNDNKNHTHSHNHNSLQLRGYAIVEYISFEEALGLATDLVIAQYIGSKAFGENLVEFEFYVKENLLGYASSRIFIYVDKTFGYHVSNNEKHFMVDNYEIKFHKEVYYLLPLVAINNPLASIDENGFTLILNTVINLNDLTESTMYGENLIHHSTDFDFEYHNNPEKIISFVVEITRYNTPIKRYIQSNDLSEIILNSQNVLKIEINEPLRLYHEQITTDWIKTDLYYFTVLEVLKGYVIGYSDNVITLPANFAQVSDKFLVAVNPIREGSSWFDLTSRTSIFSLDYFYEINKILEN